VREVARILERIRNALAIRVMRRASESGNFPQRKKILSVKKKISQKAKKQLFTVGTE